MKTLLKQARSLYEKGAFKESEALLRQKGDPEVEPDLEWSYLLGLCCAQQNRTKQAKEALERVIAKDSNCLRLLHSRLILSVLYNRESRFQEAKKLLEAIVQEGSESAQIYASLGFSCWGMGEKKESIAVLERALQIDPENPNVLNMLGYILSESQENLPQALKYCQKAVSRSPENASYLDSLGWTLFKMGDRAGAKRCLQKALSLEPSCSVIQKHLEKVIREIPS